jgi:hypothetical protein
MSGSQQLLLGGVPTVPAVDPYFYSVTSLLHGDGTNGGQNNTFLDSSSNNFSITRNGNTTQGSFSPFSQTGWGNYFDGSGDYLSLADNAALNLGTGDFTLEGWVYITGFPGSNAVAMIAKWASGNYAYIVQILSPSTLRLYTGNSGSLSSFYDHTYTWQRNSWTHIAITRESSTLRFFVNGLLIGSNSSITQSLSNSSSFILGQNLDGGGQDFTGYMSNVRVVKGTAVYTANFTPPTAPLTAITNTSLLTCQANRFLDASTNAFAITVNGDVSVQPFSPFNPTTAYSTSAVGGSGYFDGSGDYLQSSITALSGQFTVEFWVYRPVAGNNFLFTIGDSSTSSSAEIYIGSSGAQLNYYSNNAVRINGGTPPAAGQWNYFAVTRDASNDVRLYANGVQVGSSYNQSGTLSTDLRVGAEYYSGSVTATLNGYMGAFRVSNTVRTVTSVPTSLWQSDANTVFLANFTNGAIFDNAAVADYETVGNAQISTSVKKYGTGSIAFDGTGDYLVPDAPSTQLMTFGTGDFTIEMWIYPTALAGANRIIYDSRPTSTQGLYPAIYCNGAVLTYYINSADRITGPSLSTNTWYHIAVCRVASQTKMFVNGTQVGSTYADTNAYLNSTARPVIGTSGFAVTNDMFFGYIDDLRISKGVARYPYNFTPPTAEFPNIGGTVTLTADPYFDYTTLLLPGNGTNGAQNNTFLDSSTNNFTITRNGNTTQGTFSPFSQTGWGNYFDGTGDYLSAGSGTNNVTLSGDFCIEAWIYRNANADGTIVGNYNSSPNRGWSFRSYSSNNLYMYFQIDGGSEIIYTTSSATLQLQQWTHVVWCRSGTNTSVYINGTRVDNRSLSGTSTGNGGLSISALSQSRGDINFNGYISNARVVNGSSVYDPSQTSITVPTTPLTAITNTSLLTCQSNRFVDNSSNAFAITRNGDVSVQAFSPFNPTAAWSAATYGGSGYFDGSGDYLTVPDNAAFDFGSGDFTISAWVYPQGAGGIIDQGGGGASSNRSFEIYMSSASSISNAYISSDGTYQAGYNLTGTTVPNAWNFIEFTRASGTLRLFVNGVQQSSVSANVTIFNSTATVAIGNTSANAVNPYTGYISDVRVLKGTGAATSTVPTAPLTAISNTQLLTNFTNAGIYDATSKNDLETVGNAQISTAQSKFGGSSMLFDGTGDWLRAPSGPITSLEGDFTAEGWVYLSSTAAAWPVFTVGDSNGSTGIELYRATSNGKWRVLSNNTAQIDSTTSTSTGSWVHLAVTRYSGVVRLFINGINEGSTWSTTGTFSGAVYVGAEFYGGSVTVAANGYIQDLRITKGIARYTSNFTPPTTAFLTL